MSTATPRTPRRLPSDHEVQYSSGRWRYHCRPQRPDHPGLSPACKFPFREVAAKISVLLSVGSLLHAYNKTEDALLCASAIMRFLTLTCFLGTVLAPVITMSGVCSARNTSKHDCVSFAEASKHVGTAQCVSGTVLHVADGGNGVTFLTFCQDHKTCPFTVVVFPDDLEKVGDIQQLEGGMIEIKGNNQNHDA